MEKLVWFGGLTRCVAVLLGGMSGLFSGKWRRLRPSWLWLLAMVWPIGGAATEVWEPIAPADLAATAAKDGTGADLEYLRLRVSVEQGESGTVFRYDARVKIFTKRGVEGGSLLFVESPENSRISGLAARIVKPDGSSIELRKSDFIKSVALRTEEERTLRTSFAFPGLEAGDIVDYRWREDATLWRQRIMLWGQQHFPVREYRLEMDPGVLGLQAMWFHLPQPERIRKDASQLVLSFRNLPAFVREPVSTPASDARGWVLLVAQAGESDPTKAWDSFRLWCQGNFNRDTAPNEAIKRKAAELIAGTADSEAQIRRLFDFCREQIVNVEWSDDPVARAERERTSERDPQSARETLRRGFGRPDEIDCLFAALLRAAGFAPRSALNAARTELLDPRAMAGGWSFLTTLHVALPQGDAWRFFSPGDRLVPFGMNHPDDEDAEVFIIDGPKSGWQRIPISAPELSPTKRRGRFSLAADGTLRGEVEVTFAGHAATLERRGKRDREIGDLRQALQAEVGRRFQGAVVSEASWDGLTAFDGPVVLRYSVEVPGYAEAAGSATAIAPDFFTRSAVPLFTSPVRQSRLMWSHAEQITDDIEIALPPELAFEPSLAPKPVRDASGQFVVDYQLGYSPRRHALIFRRHYRFAPTRGLIFPVTAYPLFKQLHEAMHRGDNHAVLLRSRPIDPAKTGP